MKVDLLAFGAHPDDVELGCFWNDSPLYSPRQIRSTN